MSGGRRKMKMRNCSGKRIGGVVRFRRNFKPQQNLYVFFYKLLVCRSSTGNRQLYLIRRIFTKRNTMLCKAKRNNTAGFRNPHCTCYVPRKIQRFHTGFRRLKFVYHRTQTVINCQKTFLTGSSRICGYDAVTYHTVSSCAKVNHTKTRICKTWVNTKNTAYFSARNSFIIQPIRLRTW